MDRIKSRITTVIEALTARRAFVVGGIFAVATTVAAWAPKISFGGQPKLLSTPAWTWGVIAALVMTLYFVFEYAHRRRMSVLPRVRVSYNQDDCLVQTPTKIFVVTDGQVKATDSKGTYVRVKIETLSKLTIKDCVAFLVALEKKDTKSGRFTPIKVPTPVPLTTEPFVVHHSVPHFVDIMIVGQADNVPQLPPPYPFILQNVFDEQTHYRFTVSVVAGEITKTQRIEVNWPGVWNGVTAFSIDN